MGDFQFKLNYQGGVLFFFTLTHQKCGFCSLMKHHRTKMKQYIYIWGWVKTYHYYGGITIHLPAIFVYHPGTRVLTHNHIYIYTLCL